MSTNYYVNYKLCMESFGKWVLRIWGTSIFFWMNGILSNISLFELCSVNDCLSICLFVYLSVGWLVGWLLSHKSPRRITICKILLKIAESLLCLGWNSNSKWNPIYGPKMHNQLSRFDCHILTVEKIIDSKNPFLNVNVLLLSSLRG